MITSNTHFAIATHVLTALALHEGTLMTSGQLAYSVDTNPAFLRAVLGRLREAELIQTRLGKGGGSTLARPARAISLLDVFRATEGTARLAQHDCGGSACVVGQQMPKLLKGIECRLDTLLAKELSGTTIADLAAELHPVFLSATEASAPPG
jgi:Rrf2 family protein